jgi:eukaryotic-like serine/threonine-protein kinase
VTPEPASPEAGEPSLPAGTLLGDRYLIEREIGRGGMAEVYLARDIQHERPVAVKVLRRDIAYVVGVDRFLREIDIAGRLQHTHVLSLLDSGITTEEVARPFYVMPFVEGETLRARLDREHQLPVDEAVRISRAVASALGHAHALGLIHRDIKPENILLGGDQVLVADFGIAHAATAAAGETLTRTGMILGTPPYMSPEQGGASPVDERSDLYSLGCVLYEMLSGEPPFTGRTSQAIIARHMYEHPPAIEVVRPEVPAPVLQVVGRLLAKSPADRFRSAAELDAALASAVLRPGLPARSQPRLRWWLVGVTGVVLTGWLLWRVLQLPPALDPSRVVVFPLVDQRAGQAGGSSGEVVALMIGTTLGQVEPMRWLYGWLALGPRERANPRLLSSESARAIAVRQRAGYYVAGWIMEEGDSTSVILTLTDAAGHADPIQRRISARRGERTPTQLGLAAMTALLPSLLGHSVDLSVLSQRNPAAIAEFLLGEVDYYRSRFIPALEHYHRALEADSALAIAAVKGAQAAGWAERQEEAARFIAAAEARAGALPNRYVSLIRGLRAYDDGQADSAVARLEEAISDAPDWSEAWMALGEVYRHLLPNQVPLDSLAEDAFTRAAALDSSFTPPLFHLAGLAIRRGDLPTAHALVARFRAAQPDSAVALPLSLILRCVDGQMALEDWRTVAAMDWADVIDAAMSLAAPDAAPRCSLDAFRAVMEEDRAPGDYRPNAYYALQSLLVMQGRTEELRRLAGGPFAARYGGAWYLLLDAITGAPTGREADSVVRAQGEGYAGMPAITLWVLGLWQAGRHDTARVRAIGAALVRMADSTGLPRDRLFAEIVAAHASLSRGDSAEAMQRFSALHPVANRTDAVWSPWGALSFERLTEARLRQAVGDWRGALSAVQALDAPAPPISSWLCQAEAFAVGIRAAEALGNRDLAEQYRLRLKRIGREDLLHQARDALTTGVGRRLSSHPPHQI